MLLLMKVYPFSLPEHNNNFEDYHEYTWVHVYIIRWNRCMTCDFTSFSTVFQLYRDNESVTWADPDTHKPRRWKASSSPKVIYVAYIPTMFSKHIEQGKLICILTFHKRYITFPSEKFRPETWPGKPVGKATPVRQLTSSHRCHHL